MIKEGILPWQCPDHPDAQIHHTWDQAQYYILARKAGENKENHKYECAECGRKLSSPLKLT